VKAVVFHGPRNLRLEERQKPEIVEPTEAVVRVTVSAICTSDVAAYTGARPKPPGTIGHEFAGEVESAGPAVERFKPGQRVASPFSVFCGGCFYCKQGLLSACERYQIYGRELPGAQAEYVRVPNADAVLEPIPDGVSDEQAVFLTHVLTGAFYGLEAAGLKAGDSVVVLGCGPTGLSAQLVARTMGAGAVFGVDHHAYRLAAAAEAGATPLNFESDGVATTISDATGGRGADLVVEAVGTAEALAEATGLVRPWGTVLNLGTGIEDAGDFPIGRLAAKQARLISANIPPVKNAMAALARMIARGVIDPMPLASHTLGLDDVQQAYELMANKRDNALKVLLKP
jgi:alcohol dehydrogenase